MTASVYKDVATAKNPREAILKLADAIDKVNARLDKLEQDDGWGDWATDLQPWSTDEEHVEASKAIELLREDDQPPARVTEDEIKAFIMREYGADPDEMDRSIIAQIRRDIAQGRERAAVQQPDDLPYMENGELIDFSPPDPETAERRRHMAEHVLQLDTAWGPAPEGQMSWADAFVKAGPMWLYMADRDLVMAYDNHIKAMLIEDVLKQSPRAAHEMSIDILKDTSGEHNYDNPGSQLADSDQVKNIRQLSDWRPKE